MRVLLHPVVPSSYPRTFHFRLHKAATFLLCARYSLVSCRQSQLGIISAVSSDPVLIPITLLVVLLFRLINHYACVLNILDPGCSNGIPHNAEIWGKANRYRGLVSALNFPSLPCIRPPSENGGTTFTTEFLWRLRESCHRDVDNDRVEQLR